MRISYIITVYNLQQYIEECVESVIRDMAGTDCELVLIDDGSTDNTGVICDNYAAQYDFVKVVHQQNGGLAHARNVGTQVAQGEWLCFIDGDDYLLPGLTQAALPHLDDHNLDILFFDNADGTNDAHYEVLPAATGALFKRCALYASPLLKQDPAYINVHVTTMWAKFYRKQFLLDNYLWSKEDVVLAQDIIFNLNVYSYEPRMAFINKRFYHHRILFDSCCHRYRPNYGTISDIFVKRMYEILEERYQNRADMLEISYCTVLNLINNYLVLNSCSEQNPNSPKERAADFWGMLNKEAYRIAVERCNETLLTEDQRGLLGDIRSCDFNKIENRIKKGQNKKKTVAYLQNNARWLLKAAVALKQSLKRLLKS